MNRNLHSRIEVAFPVYDKKLQEELGHILQLQFSDNSKAVLLNTNLENERIRNNGSPIAAQQAIYEYVKGLEG